MAGRSLSLVMIEYFGATGEKVSRIFVPRSASSSTDSAVSTEGGGGGRVWALAGCGAAISASRAKARASQAAAKRPYGPAMRYSRIKFDAPVDGMHKTARMPTA